MARLTFKLIKSRGYLKMAKKKHAKKAAPSKVQNSNSMGWIVAAIVVIVIIAYFVMKSGNQAPANAGNEPSQAPAVPGALTTSTAPETNDKCVVANSPTGPTIGIVPGTMTVNNNVVAVTFKNSGKVDISSTYFAFSDSTGKTVWKLNTDSIAVGATVEYSVDLNQVAGELGSSVNTFTAYPVMDSKACKNGAVYVIKTNK